MRNVLFALILVLAVSCQREEESYLPIEPLDLSSCQTISYQSIDAGDYLLSYPTAISYTEGKLIIKDDKGQQELFHVLTADGKLVQEFLAHGDGPEECASSTFNFQLSDDHRLEMFDDARSRVTFFDGNSGDFRFSSSFSARMNGEYFREMVSCGVYFIGMGMNGRFDNDRFLVLDTLGNVIKTTGEYPAIKPELFVKPEEDFQTMLFHTSLFRVSPDKQKAVFATYKGALIQFADLSALPDSISSKSILLERPKKKEQITHDNEGWVFGFEDVCATNHSVYAIYNGETAVDNPGLGQYILKFDWNGNLLGKYRFDIGLRCLTVDEESGTVFFIGYVDDEMKLFSGQLQSPI